MFLSDERTAGHAAQVDEHTIAADGACKLVRSDRNHAIRRSRAPGEHCAQANQEPNDPSAIPHDVHGKASSITTLSPA